MSFSETWTLFDGKTVQPLDRAACAAARARIDSQAKPLRSLGRLESIAERLAGMRYPMDIDPARVFTVAGDHGVAEEGVSLFPKAVTRQMVENFLAGGAGVNALTLACGMQLEVVDAGCEGGPFGAGVIDARLGDGTANMARGPAMSMDTCVKGLKNGIKLAQDAVQGGCRCLAIGEMGIANSTPATALYAWLLDMDPSVVVGPGTGIDEKGMVHKANVVRRAIEVNAEALGPGENPDPVRALACLGGFEIVTMAGIVLGGALCGVPVLVDGFISSSAYVAAVLACPTAAEYCFVAHASTEPGHVASMEKLAGRLAETFHGAELTRPLLDLGFHLGEGTGCAAAFPLLRGAVSIYRHMATFGEAGVSTSDGASSFEVG